jgi:membrane fusion protein, multidrug efflux system
VKLLRSKCSMKRSKYFGSFVTALSLALLSPLQVAASELDAVVELLERQVFEGVVEAGERTQVSNSVNGTLLSVNFINGQRVQKGDVLFELSKQTSKLDVELAENEVLRREVELEVAQDAAERASSLADTGTVTVLRKLETKQALALAEVTLREARAKLKKAKVILSATTIEAQASGWIVAPKHDLGAYLKTQTRRPLAEILDLDTVLVSYLQPYDALIELQSVSPLPMPELLKMLDVYVILPNGTIFGESGKITSTDNELDEQGNLRVWARFNNPQILLIPGLRVQTTVQLKK